MAGISKPRRKVDPVAIASQGRATSQIQTQESSDKPRTNEANDDIPRIISTKD